MRPTNKYNAKLAPVLITAVAAAALVAPHTSSARMNPLMPIERQVLRPEVVIVLDTSGSMQWRASSSSEQGTDCSGNDTALNLCGDGLCSGTETTSNCANDCNISDHWTSTSGTPPQCKSSSSVVSRMFMLKRALTNILPDLRASASFSLVTFKQDNYYLYYKKSSSSSSTRKVTIFLSEWELRGSGSWVGGSGWDSGANAPVTSFTKSSTTYTILSNSSVQAASHIDKDQDSLYRRDDTAGFVYKRFKWSTAGKNYNDGTYTWKYIGTYYNYDQYKVSSSTAYVKSTYKGPQYTDGSQVWIHQRFNWSDYQYINGSYDGKLVIPFLTSETQTDHDGQIGQLLNRFNFASNGGLSAEGGTPLGEAMDTAKQHYKDRNDGTGPFSGAPDSAAACRQRYVITLTDGQWNGSLNPETITKNLYDQYPQNPIKTFAIGIPGLPSGAITTLDHMSDYGDDGQLNNSTTALFSNDEKELVDNIKKALYAALGGDYTTSAPGVATVDTGTGVSFMDNVALLTSTEFPGWKGHLRAIDTTQSTPTQIWDAGEQLNTTNWQARKLYTGYPDTYSGGNAGKPVIMLDSTGTANVTGSGGFGGKGVKDAWPTGITPPSDNEISAMIQWVAGKGRAWKLDAMMRSVPATVGPPPSLPNLGDHSSFEASHASRPTVIYAVSSIGLLHAFDSKTGNELFAYLPPHLLPKVYALYQQGGQNDDPANFTWIAASSPRVADVPLGSGQWITQLALTNGPGNEQFAILDITDPMTCTGSPLSCTLNDPPIKVLTHTQKLSPSIDSSIGETWSLPAMFYHGTGTDLKIWSAMGSGYNVNINGEGSYYNLFTSINPEWDSSGSHHQTDALTVSAPKVNPVGLLADTVAAVNYDNALQGVATYQADLAGRITRFAQGQTGGSNKTTLLDVTASYPFHYAPAVLHRHSGQVTLAAASGSYEENDPWIVTPSVASKLYLRSETDGVIDSSNDNLTCAIDNICSCSGLSVTSTCSNPSNKAQPITRPFIVENTAAGGQVEAFYLYWDPPTSRCYNNQIAIGDTWLVRVGTQGNTQKLIESKKFTNALSSGMAIMGGTVGFVLSTSGRGSQAASIAKVSGGQAAAATTGVVTIESWKEAQ